MLVTSPSWVHKPAGGKLDPNASFSSQDPVAVAAGERLPGEAAWMMWPVWHAQTVYDGAVAAGAEDGPGGTWSLARSAWAGSHRYNTIVWSGDITSDWTTLASQVQVGLSAMLTLPYWNSDTGGKWITAPHTYPPSPRMCTPVQTTSMNVRHRR